MSDVTKVEDLPTPEELVNWAVENNYIFIPCTSGENGCALNALAKFYGKHPAEKLVAPKLGEMFGMNVAASYAIACTFDLDSPDLYSEEMKNLSDWAARLKALAKEKGVYEDNPCIKGITK